MDAGWDISNSNCDLIIGPTSSQCNRDLRASFPNSVWERTWERNSVSQGSPVSQPPLVPSASSAGVSAGRCARPAAACTPVPTADTLHAKRSFARKCNPKRSLGTRAVPIRLLGGATPSTGTRPRNVEHRTSNAEHRSDAARGHFDGSMPFGHEFRAAWLGVRCSDAGSA